MSNNNFSRRHRGMRFRPKGGLGHNPQKPDREATQARADVVSEQGGNERVFEKRHQQRNRTRRKHRRRPAARRSRRRGIRDAGEHSRTEGFPRTAS